MLAWHQTFPSKSSSAGSVLNEMGRHNWDTSNLAMSSVLSVCEVEIAEVEIFEKNG